MYAINKVDFSTMQNQSSLVSKKSEFEFCPIQNSCRRPTPPPRRPS